MKNNTNNKVELIHEKVFTIYVNGRSEGTVSCTPVDLRQLAVGWLFTEGRIKDPSGITRVEEKEEEQSIRVLTMELIKDGSSQIDTSDRQRTGRRGWTEDDLKWISQAFAEEPPLRAATKAAHSCMVVRKVPEQDPQVPEQDPQVLYRSEDAGRHSALDKAIGWAMLNDVDLGDCFLMTSGRISTRMAAKAGRAGASALAGKGTVTAEAVELAEEYGMTLIGYVKDDSATWFCDPSAGADPARD